MADIIAHADFRNLRQHCTKHQNRRFNTGLAQLHALLQESYRKKVRTVTRCFLRYAHSAMTIGICLDDST